ncbi:C4-dicarboxylate ABC transporter permease [Thalassobaculum fulvum]|jgi:TRAP-type C4-dicarboxylate transport system permease small subunit|uniref:TRAP transporter small permease protein n=1 Tax=Thalassobaculum fulvum TaxID=1633335 RepID=A0A918XNC7_9PROT|nr:TRAP transporter small permease [Thalassobaculum fulvum]GHD41520.1 C4-dicarboxylate ABC transporter permease [Thalassobaculum fulvum]
MTRVLDHIDRALRIAITALIALLIVPVTLQILARYIDFVPRYIWTEEVARFCFVWIIMLGAMIAVRDDSHFDVDVLPHPRTAAGEGWARLVVHLIMFALALCFIWYGKQFADEGLLQSSEIADLPMIAIYAAWPLAGVVWTLFLIEKLATDIRKIRGGGAQEDTDVAG